jgi:dihydroflavonol-4-reductase
MRVLVTGAAGFVGLNITSALCKAGHEVRAFLRPSSNKKYISEYPVEIMEGDLLNPHDVNVAASGMTAIIHCAGVTSGFKKDREIAWLTNVDGTKNVIAAANKAKIQRLVYTSSTSTVGYGGITNPATETTPLTDFRKNGQYSRSKVAAELLIRDAVRGGMNAIILNPAEVLGEYDYHFGWGSVITGLLHKAIPFIPAGGGSFCEALEVGKAHEAALIKGKSGDRYILAGTNISYANMFHLISDITGSAIPKVNMFTNSYCILKHYFGVQEKLYPITKRLPPMDAIRLKSFYTEMYYSGEKAERELGFRATSMEKMIERSYNWYKKNNMV